MKKGHSYNRFLLCSHCNGSGISAQSKNIIVDCLFCYGVGFINTEIQPETFTVLKELVKLSARTN